MPPRITPQPVPLCLTMHRLLPRIPCACASRGMCARYFSLIRTSPGEYAIFAMNNQNTIHYGQEQHLEQASSHPHHHPHCNCYHLWGNVMHGCLKENKNNKEQSPAQVRSKSSSPFLHFGWCKGLQGKKINNNGGTGKKKLCQYLILLPCATRSRANPKWETRPIQLRRCAQ